MTDEIPERKERCSRFTGTTLLCRQKTLPSPFVSVSSLPSLAQGRNLQRQAAYLRVVHTQGLDLVKWKQDTDEKHLVLFLKGQGKAIDDARSQGTFLGPNMLKLSLRIPQSSMASAFPTHLPRISRSSAIPL